MKIILWLFLLVNVSAFSKSIKMNKRGPNLSSKARSIFKKRVSIFGINLIATENVKDSKLLHAAHVMAQYLDNNQDGIVDDPKVIAHMIKQKATLAMFESASERNELEEDIEESDIERYQDLFDHETRPGGSSREKFDASLEEVLHLITFAGYHHAYPKIFGPLNSAVTKAMDKARGGHYEEAPSSYPEGAWFTYNDESCHYDCMVTEYFYWALTSYLGGQDFAGRGSEIEDEWQLHTKEKLKERDILIYKIIQNPKYQLPKKMPQGKHKLLKNIKIDTF